MEKASDFLNRIPLGTPEQERQQAKNWVETAAFHARNEEFWHNNYLELKVVLFDCAKRFMAISYQEEREELFEISQDIQSSDYLAEIENRIRIAIAKVSGEWSLSNDCVLFDEESKVCDLFGAIIIAESLVIGRKSDGMVARLLKIDRDLVTDISDGFSRFKRSSINEAYKLGWKFAGEFVKDE